MSKTARINYQERLAGLLTESDAGYEFVYDAGYLKTPGAAGFFHDCKDTCCANNSSTAWLYFISAEGLVGSLIAYEIFFINLSGRDKILGQCGHLRLLF